MMVGRPAFAAALMLASCATAPALLAGSEWRVVAINGHATPSPPASYRMRFEARQLSGQFGCNHFGGEYRTDGDALTTGAIMMTEMACAGAAGQFEHWGMLVLQRPVRIIWESDDRIRLANAAGSIELSR